MNLRTLFIRAVKLLLYLLVAIGMIELFLPTRNKSEVEAESRKLRELIQQTNNNSTILNEARFGPITNDTLTVIVIQVRTLYCIVFYCIVL